MVWVDHGGVAARAELRVELEELLVAQMEEVDLGVEEGRVHVLVQLPVPVVHKSLYGQAPIVQCLFITMDLRDF